MDYKEADGLLQGRCRDSRKLANNTYLKRRNRYEDGKNAIAVLLHATDIITFFENGYIQVNTGGWGTVTTRDRINRYLPDKWRVYSERGCTILSDYRWTEEGRKGTAEVLLGHTAVINSNGTITGGSDVAEWRADYQNEDRERKRERSRLLRWLTKAAGISRDKSGCTQRWCSCHPKPFRRHRIPTVGTCHCGCLYTYKKPDPGRLTVAEIMEETNASVRVAMIQVFGLERFFLEANPELVNEEAGYQLLRLKFGSGWNTQAVTVLKMSCPSTGAVYINTVPPETQNVRQALDWMFDTKDYLARVTQAA